MLNKKMAKITYYLGAGASYNACPILEKQAEMMIALARMELTVQGESGGMTTPYLFIESERNLLPNDNIIKILWHIGYFGKQAQSFNTIDTYARKLKLSGTDSELNLLKMSISVFFDLWENFYEERYSHFFLDPENEIRYKNIDYRYTSLFSVLLERERLKLTINDSFKFITWNYDLQLESTFQSFMRENEVKDLNQLNQYFFPFMENNEQDNDVYHLNGHRGFFKEEERIFQIKNNISYEQYWSGVDWLFKSTEKNSADFHKYIKYAWEHDIKSEWFERISKILRETEVLVIIGYSFPPFNRSIDQFLFSRLDSKKIKKIVYQDPNGNKQIIENLFKDPDLFKDKIFIEKESMNQFHLPNEHFIKQKNIPLDFNSVNLIP